MGFPDSSVGKESACNAGGMGLIPRLGRSPGEGKRLPTPAFWPGELHGLYSPWGCKESDKTEQLSLSLLPMPVISLFAFTCFLWLEHVLLCIAMDYISQVTLLPGFQIGLVSKRHWWWCQLLSSILTTFSMVPPNLVMVEISYFLHGVASLGSFISCVTIFCT